VAKILVVDDDPDVRLMLRILLETDGHDVIDAVDAAEGIALTLAEEPEIIVLDQMMPGITGLECLGALRTAAPGVRVVMYSAIRRRLDDAPGDKADVYVDKGDVEELLQAVGTMAAAGSERSGGPSPRPPAPRRTQPAGMDRVRFATPTGEPCPRCLREDGILEGSGDCLACGFCLLVFEAAWSSPGDKDGRAIATREEIQMAEAVEQRVMTPGWFDIGTDVAGAKEFYGRLFGWEAQDAGPVDQTGGYGFFTLGGRQVAGYGPQQNPGPPVWSMYVMVTDADATTAAVQAAGGTVVVPPMDVMDQGRMAIFQDAGGAFFSVWQAGAHRGAQVGRQTGAFTWCELDTRDVAGATAFYDAVFGWGARTSTPAEGEPMSMPYTEFQLDGESIAGMMDMPPGVPAEVPDYWLLYVGVDDVDATVASATELGGSVTVPGMDFPGGRFAVLADPQGAMFGVMTSTAGG
jgi:predicted enzyme related to lactoylglutathione lyase/CheY-like chemotaxis protein